MKRWIASLLCAVLLLSLCANVAIETFAADNNQQVEAVGGTQVSADGNVTISKTIAPTDKENYFDITLTVTEKEQKKQAAVDIVLVLDISNTMNTNSRIDNAKKAAKSFVQQYSATDKLGAVRNLGLVTFNTNAAIKIPLQQVNKNSVTKAIDGLNAPSDSSIKYTNIEGGLRLAQQMLSSSNSKYKFIVLITDGFPTTFTQTAGTDTMLGYSTYDSTGKIFKDRVLNLNCSAGVDYSDTAAQKAQDTAATIKSSGINIVSIGIDVSDSHTIQKYLDRHKGKDFSTVDRYSSDKYVIGSATDSASYGIWLGTKIGGGKDFNANPDVSSNTFYRGDSSDELNNAFNSILKTVELITSRTMTDSLAVDPMGEFIGFLGFYNQSGALTDSLNGSYTENAENTASYSAAGINWNLQKSGYTKAVSGNETTYSYTLKYRVRLENEKTGFLEHSSGATNGSTTLNYKDPANTHVTLNFPIPAVEGYLGELSFTKLDASGNPLAGAEFTLRHNITCSVCGGKVVIADQIVTSGDNGLVNLTGIPSGHEYTLLESKAPEGYQKADSHQVVVSYDKTYYDGVDVSTLSAITIANKKLPPVSVKLEGAKTMNGEAPEKDAFTFQLKDNYGNVVQTSNDANGKFAYNLSYSSAGTYTYQIMEAAGTDTSIVYDPTVYDVTVVVAPNDSENPTGYLATVTIKNHATGDDENAIVFSNADRKPVAVRLEAQKKLEGRELKAEEFGFVLTDVTDPENPVEIETVKNDADGVITFAELSYNTIGTFRYNMKEVEGELGGVSYDNNVYTITITTEDDGEGGLKVTQIVTDSEGETVEDIVFANTYSIETYAEVTLSGVKTLEGRDLESEEFSFELYTADENYTPAATAEQTVKNSVDGTFAFNKMTIDEEGTWYYVVKETKGTFGGVEYDETVYHVSITATDNGEGALEAEVVITDSKGNVAKTLTFANKYTPAADITLDVTAKKTVKNVGVKSIGPEGFQFRLVNTADDTGVTAESDKNGIAAFQLKYTYADVGKTFTYKLFEVNTKITNVTYSKASYEIQVAISLDKQTNKLVAKVTNNGESVDQIVGEFVNTYDVNKIPDTGDSSQLFLWLGLMTLSALLIAVAFRYRRRMV